MTNIPAQRTPAEFLADVFGAMDSARVTACPVWCSKHAPNEVTTHQSAEWRGDGLSVVIESGHDFDTTIEVDKVGGPGLGYLSLTPTQAQELGAALVRAADRVRRAKAQR